MMSPELLNAYAPEKFAAAEADFRQTYPTYTATAPLDDLRATDYARLDNNNEVYLDYTGGGLYAQSQIEAHMKLLTERVWGNPHSHNPTSLAMTELVDRARAYVLTYFRADPAEYDVIFTANASGALKLVGESFPFVKGGRFLLTFDNHNSVNGIREFARSRGADVHYLPTQLPDLRLNRDDLITELDRADRDVHNLFAYPAQSNFTGVQHDLEFIAEARQRGWHVLLDAAAFTPTNRLDLSVWQSDFVALSFYKIFGYPTGIGALIARRDALTCLQRPWFAGGTITITSVQGAGWHYLIDGHAAFEDGTVDYLNLPAVEIGLRHIESVGIEHIHERVTCLTGWLLTQMAALNHDNGAPLVGIHGPLTTERRGGTIAFHIDDPDGQRLNHRQVEVLANAARISLRTGFFCNPGTGEIAYDLSQVEMGQLFASGQPLSFDEFSQRAAHDFHKFPGAVRISVGVASTFADVYAFMAFLASLRNRSVREIGSLLAASEST